MATVQVLDQRNKPAGELELDDAVFGEKRKTHVVYEQVKAHLAERRAGTHATKTRGMVSGGGKKPWRQKGTGRSRHGSNRSPLWRHGGTTHGPQPRSYGLKVNRKTRKLAMRVALTGKLQGEQVIILDQIAITEPKTRRVVEIARALDLPKASLIVAPAGDQTLRLAARNHPEVKVVSPTQLSVYDVLAHRRVIFTRDTARQVQEIFKP